MISSSSSKISSILTFGGNRILWLNILVSNNNTTIAIRNGRVFFFFFFFFLIIVRTSDYAEEGEGE